MQNCLIGLADRSANYSYVTGSIVRRVQEKLHAAGHSVGTIDGVYGRDSAAAMSAWQEKAGRPVTGEVSHEEFEILIGIKPDAFELALQLTARFEGHGFGTAKGNFDGAILTWGIIGFTFRHKSFQEVIKRIDAEAPDAIADTFGELADTFRDGLEIEPHDPAAASWADDMSQPGGNGILKPEWRDAFARLGATKIAQEKQLELARETYWARAEADAETLEINDLPGLAMCFDIAVQCGGVSDGERQTIAAEIAAETNEATARKRREIIANVVAEATSNAQWINDVRSRKLTIATGEGEVHGGRYRTRDWGLDAPSQEAVPPRISADTVDIRSPTVVTINQHDRFNAFFLALNLKHFRPDEFAFLGNRNKDPNDSAFGKNVLPAEHLWPNMIRTAQIMDRLRVDLNASIRLTNIYRHKDYNTAIGGAEHSQHMHFTAVDFYCQNGNGPEHWGAKLADYRRSGAFKGGIGIYTKKFFVHLDTRGENVDFRP